jgi:hypothetical protein
MRNSFYTRQQLSEMPLSVLRNLDIQDAEEEAMIQEIVNIKVGNMPLPHKAINRSDVPDIQTPEEEEKWQGIIDERERKLRETLTSATIPGVEISGNPPTIEYPEKKKMGCDKCGSKGWRHKAGCELAK